MLIDLGGPVGTLRGLPELGQRIVPPFFKLGGIKLKLPRGGRESLLLIFSVIDFTPDVIHFLEILPGDSHGLQDVIQPAFKVLPPIFALPDPMGQIIEHLMVGSAFSDLDDLAAGQDIAVALPKISDVIHLKPGGGR